ncbi:MAG: ABC transporter permease [Rhodospirillales bacterium]|jgi:general nucleoside transport system permease protein|nr:ABC transporter permease [Rhodospirillales bacterium]MBT4038851.1 ABC transporter permease [Rhodospirillales bacterium]MBT4627574.1 ABC transporter permease [Rhodospirillales bacterium]MBT5351778.1 ABC transporter permease [Rhodospirillales bacterium]MBT5521660.1 ABC transporter permease [Rhodospirillales bacterium]
MRLEPRESVSFWLVLLAPVGAIGVALVLTSGLIMWTGESVFEAYGHLLKGAFGSRFALTETLTRATPLMLTGLAAAVAFRARFWNIGAEGQLYCGALAATYLGTGLVTLHPTLMIPLLFVGGALAGGVVLLLPVYLKSKLSVDEVVTTLLLNFIILLFVNYLLEGPLRDPMSMGWPQAAAIIDEGVLPRIMEKSRLHLGFIIGVISAVMVWFVMRFTIWGYEIRAVGHNPSAATFAGISINLTVLRVALISGGLAGFAGVTEVAGLKGYLTLDLSPGFGYAGIAVAMLANLHPLGVIASAIFLAGIYVGADSMSRAVNIPNYIADVMVAVSVLAVLVSLMLTQYRVRVR